MEHTEIKPALTPEEWAHVLAMLASYTAEDGAEPDAGGYITHEGTLRYVDGSAILEDNTTRHARAALLLHGQPFGFTRAHVEAARKAVRIMQGEWGTSENPLDATLLALADLVEALLPPE